MDEPIRFKCPHCEAGLKARHDEAGNSGVCPRCSKTFIVPAQFIEATPSEPSPVLPPTPPQLPAPAALLSPRPAPPSLLTPPVRPAQKPKSPLHLTIALGAALVVILVALVAALAGGRSRPVSPAAPAAVAVQQPAQQPSSDPSSTAKAGLEADIERLKEENRRLAAERLAAEDAARTAELRAASPPPAAMPPQGFVGRPQAIPTRFSSAPAAPQPAAAAQPAEAAADAPAKSSLADLVERQGPSVAVISTNTGSTGAGFVALEPGLLVTNLHVIHGGTRLTVRFAAGKTRPEVSAPAQAIAVDADNDLALLRVADAQVAAIAPLPLADSDAVRAGAEVFAIGNPGMGGRILEHTVSSGIISSTDRDLDGRHFLQTTTPINPGNSGGPLFDMDGRVIGVVSAKATRQENIGFAVAANFVAKLYAERDGRYKVEGDFAKWEGAQPFQELAKAGNAIPFDGAASAMLLDAERRQLVVIAPDRNKVVFVSLADSKVVGDVFTGTDPLEILPAGKDTAWVSNRTSKSLALLNLATRKVDRTINLTRSPLSFTVVRDVIWFVDGDGHAAYVRANGSDEQEAPLTVRSLAYNPARGNLLCGSVSSWLCEVDVDKMSGVISRQRTLKNRVDDFNRHGGSPEIYDSIRRDAAANDEALQRAIKPLNQPAGTDVDFSGTLQKLFVDAAHDRVYFNRCALSIREPGKILGVFKSPEHSQEGNGQLAEFFRAYPYLKQILAVSPDGTIVASGTHLYSTSDFTVYRELPIPAVALAFDPDDRTLWMVDHINHQIVGLDYRPKDWTPPADPKRK